MRRSLCSGVDGVKRVVVELEWIGQTNNRGELRYLLVHQNIDSLRRSRVFHAIIQPV